ncbi:hypothetical protein [Pseudomonas aeruginosa]|uniref:hypothetical protein n=1 Tax=Pseudomonas aeruginosa TaxID=287 RepID=UPI001E4741B6|nr:hypothetical protein [Pseudomonas aeruginosa]MCC9290255.1 hypothetical protein [Pseudomonas aeruginosa]UVN19068.1 putative IcmC-like type IV secretion system protein [Pseudomonas aeruginosa]
MIDGSTMLASFAKQFPGLEDQLNAVVALLGLVLSGNAVFKAILVDKTGGQGMTWTTPIMYFLCGVALYNFAASIDTALDSFRGGSVSVKNLMCYQGSAIMPALTSELIRVIVHCLRFYGYMTYARGWMCMRRIASGQNGSDEVFNKSIIRLVAGVALINIVGTVNMLSETFGFGEDL